MFDSIAGIPLHPLVVHAVVILLPLACVGAGAVAVVPRWDRQFGFLVVSCAVVATGAAIVAKQSGEALASRVGFPTDHQNVAQWIPWFAGLLLICVAALWWLDRQRSGARPTSVKVVAAITIVAALVALGWVIVAGHTGATAVWGTTIETTSPDTFN